MSAFAIDAFAQSCKEAMDAAEDRHEAARAHLQETMAQNAAADMVATLEAAIPPGADLGEMIVHLSPELTMLYGRIPPRFQSGIHDHTVFACIGQLVGQEKNVFYEPDPEGGLRVTGERTIETGEVLALPVDAIHAIENPGTETASALHLYGGDFSAIMERRSLWTWDGHERTPFSFELLVRESVTAMKRDGNTVGLQAIAEAIPAVRPMIES